MSFNCQTVIGIKNKTKQNHAFLTFNHLQICSLKFLKCKHANINMNSASASNTRYLKQKCIFEKQKLYLCLP